jgi:hypothetical protein
VGLWLIILWFRFVILWLFGFDLNGGCRLRLFNKVFELFLKGIDVDISLTALSSNVENLLPSLLDNFLSD